MTQPATSLPTTEEVLPQLSRLRAAQRRTRALSAARSALRESEMTYYRAEMLVDEMTSHQRRQLALRKAELEEMRQRVAALEAEAGA